MEVLYPHCCGLDIHKKVVVACCLTPGREGIPEKEVRSFGTMTQEVLALSDWLLRKGVTHVAMESTGVYWKPLYNLLEGAFTLLLVNAQHIKVVPGRKTDVKDSEWIADLLRHGLLKASFVPERPQRELRELTRYRVTLVQERSAEVNRLQKTLEGANIKLGSVVSEILGKSAREMLEALVAGRNDVQALAQLARGTMQKKIPQLEQALVGDFGPHQRFLVAWQLAHIDFLDEALHQVSEEIGKRTAPLQAALERLDGIPGVGIRTMEGVVAEIGTDMSRFPTVNHLVSWAGMCPGNHESGGKRKSSRIRDGNRHLRTLLVEAAHAASRHKASYLAAQYSRLAARRGSRRAAVAVGHSILVIIYYLLRDPERQYEDLGAGFFDHRDKKTAERRLVRRLESLGNRVTLTPLAA